MQREKWRVRERERKGEKGGKKRESDLNQSEERLSHGKKEREEVGEKRESKSQKRIEREKRERDL